MSTDKPPKFIRSEAQTSHVPDDIGLSRGRHLIRNTVLDVSLPPSHAELETDEPRPTFDLNISDKIKCIFINGRGNTGKTVLVRIGGEVLLLSKSNFVVAACDIGSRAAMRYFRKIVTPDTNDVAEIRAFIKDVIQNASDTKRTFLIDMGAAGETAILQLHEKHDLLGMCQDLGVTPVFIHMIGTSVDDVSVLASFEDHKLCPPATALIFNEVGISVGTSRETAFGLVRAQPCVHRALERGAASLRLRALDREIGTEVEARELLYGEAMNGVIGRNKSLGPLGGWDRSGLRTWHKHVLRDLSPIGSWLGWPPSAEELFK